MILNEEQINYIAENLSFYGIKSDDLKEDLLDHICTEIENSSQTDFSIAYQKAIKKFGGYNSLERLQEKTFNSLHLNPKSVANASINCISCSKLSCWLGNFILFNQVWI